MSDQMAVCIVLRCSIGCRQFSDEFGNLVLWGTIRCGHSKEIRIFSSCSVKSGCLRTGFAVVDECAFDFLMRSWSVDFRMCALKGSFAGS